ncbi:LuxR family transcriptional regulator [Eggerthella sinensis]|uniref:helix-turn-helix transcriptional regulator n=1 Tax=Eggerthella sinensis TaxID=242230 RepID=UPI00248DB0F1|nr:LuxR family transcriptional regulator [Eggerthella sinensis]
MDARQQVRERAAAYAPLFSLNLMGLVAVRIWIQCDLYDRYLSTDSGIVTIVTNLFRVVVILALIAFAIRRGFSERVQSKLFAASIAAMTVASALFLANTAAPSPALLWTACLLAGFGIAWGGGRWICLFVRLSAREALFYAFASLGASALVGFFLGLLPEQVTYLVAILMPPLSYLAYERAERLLDERASDAPRDAVYDAEPRATFVRLGTGIVLFNLALGVTRGFPHGASIELPLPFQALHQGIVIALCAGVVWWGLVAGRGLRFSTLWNVSMTFIALGALVLATTQPALEPWGAAAVAVANTFAVGLLWFSCADIARHTSLGAPIVLGLAWVAHIAPREVGRALIWVAEPRTETAVIIATGIVLLLAASMAFLLSDRVPVTRPLFAELRRGGRARRAAAASAAPAPAEPVVDPIEGRLVLLRERHFLTERECDVVRYLAQGRSKTAIGEKLFISENTVRTYVKNIYGKLDVHNKQQLLDFLDALDAE